MSKIEGDAGLSEHMAKGMLKLFILFSLSKGTSHGYSLLKDFRSKAKDCPSETKKDVGVGEFYSMISSLENARLVKSSWSKDSGKRPKKILSITDKGKKVVSKAKRHFASAMGMFREIIPEIFSDGIARGGERK